MFANEKKQALDTLRIYQISQSSLSHQQIYNCSVPTPANDNTQTVSPEKSVSLYTLQIDYYISVSLMPEA